VQFNPDNKVIKLCADGMAAEGHGQMEKAKDLFLQAWEESESDFEKFTSAHFVARHQDNVSDKLKWDEIALEMALKIKDEEIKGSYPSLYLNIGKCYEDLNDRDRAKEYYELASSYQEFLSDDGYGKMISSGIISGLARVSHIDSMTDDR
jgi:tetratricopeptide (TPR) repeat protein